MLLSRANLTVKEAASDDPKAPWLNRVQVEADGTTVASNGSLFLAVSPVSEELEGMFPMVDPDKASPGKGGVGISLELAGDALRSMPRDRRVSVQQAQMTRCDSGTVELMTTNGVKKRKSAGMPMRGTFPKWKGVIRKAREAADAGRICVNGKDLVHLLAAVMKACPDRGNQNPVWLEFGGELDAIVAHGVNYETGQSVVGMVSPLDTGGQWLEESDWVKGLGKEPVKVRVRKGVKIRK